MSDIIGVHLFFVMKLAALIILPAAFAMPAVADDVDRWIQDPNDTGLPVREAAVVALGWPGDTRRVEISISEGSGLNSI